MAVRELKIPTDHGADGFFRGFVQTSIGGGAVLSTEKFPTTMSTSPSPSMSPTSSVAWRGIPISIVWRTKMPGVVCSSHTSAGSVVSSTSEAARKQRTRDDIQVAVAVEIGGFRRDARQASGDRVLDERIGAGILEPLDAVIRLHEPIVERIAVCEEDVEVAVLVEVDQLNPDDPQFGCGAA